MYLYVYVVLARIHSTYLCENIHRKIRLAKKILLD